MSVLRKSSEIYKGKIVHLFLDEVILPNGTACLIELIRHGGAAAVVPMLDDETLILIKQYRHAAGGFIWEIPAGRLDPGEDPLVCAQRELREEVGYRAANFEKLTAILTAPGFCDEKIHIYLATGLEPCHQSLEDDEVLYVTQKSLSEAIDMVWRGEISDAKTIIGLQLAYFKKIRAHKEI